MSSFMCSPETIYLITDHLFKLEKIREMNRILNVSKDPLSVDRLDIFKHLYKLNKDALLSRYEKADIDEIVGYTEEEGFKQARSHFNDAGFISDYILFYKIECFLYQCAEGNVPERPLYKFIEAEQAALAIKIVRDSKDYLDVSIDEWN